jgi:hypothetical protein
MSNLRRDFFKQLLAAGTLQGLIASSGTDRAMGALLDQDSAKEINPDFDAQAYSFWSGFFSSDAEPIVRASGQSRRSSPRADNDQPVFLHYGPEGFKNAAELDVGKLVSTGDVMVSVNTSTVKVAEADQKTFQQLQNAQIRVDVAQKTGIIPILEAMAYTVVGGMRSVQTGIPSASKSTPAKKAPATVQSISVSSDAAWQKMQNIPLPGGEGRWALNLEAQKKDSLFCKVLQNFVKKAGLFVPVLGFPGIVMSALNSFNTIYGVLHAGTVSIIKGNPVRVFATQEAVQRTGAPGSVTGILLQSGSYILMPAKQLPPMDQLKSLTVTQGRLVPAKTALTELDEAAADTLKDVTYVTFDVEVTPATFVTGAVKKSG